MKNKIKSFLWSESPVMWIPWIQFIVNYFFVLPSVVFGALLLFVGACNALSGGELTILLWGVGLIIAPAVIAFALDWHVIEKSLKK
mgnify:CR=1 FL=1